MCAPVSGLMVAPRNGGASPLPHSQCTGEALTSDLSCLPQRHGFPSAPNLPRLRAWISTSETVASGAGFSSFLKGTTELAYGRWRRYHETRSQPSVSHRWRMASGATCSCCSSASHTSSPTARISSSSSAAPSRSRNCLCASSCQARNEEGAGSTEAVEGLAVQRDARAHGEQRRTGCRGTGLQRLRRAQGRSGAGGAAPPAA